MRAERSARSDGVGEDQDHVRIGPRAAAAAAGVHAVICSSAEPSRSRRPAAGASRQRGPDFGGAPAGRGQHRHLRVGAAHVDRRTQVTAVGAHHDSVVPGHPGAGEGQRDRGHRGQDHGARPRSRSAGRCRRNPGRRRPAPRRRQRAPRARPGPGPGRRAPRPHTCAPADRRPRARRPGAGRRGAGSTGPAPGGGKGGQRGKVPASPDHERGRSKGRRGLRTQRRPVHADDADLPPTRPIMPRSPTPAWWRPRRGCR